MKNEAGDMKTLGNFRRLIDIVKVDANYQPTNDLLTIVNLEKLLADGIASVDEIAVKIAPNKVAINDRQTAFTEALSLVRGSRNLLKASGVSQKTIEDADTFSRKVLGIRKSKKTADNPNTNANEATKNHSASQQSYDAILGNFRSYNEILKNEPLYAPNEAKFKTTALNSKADELETKSNTVSLTFVPLKNARTTRDELLYTGENCICNVAQMVKSYIKAIYGINSPQYKSISGLAFRR